MNELCPQGLALCLAVFCLSCSAAVVPPRTEVDLRVDDHARPIDELERLLAVHQRLNPSDVPEAERTPDTPELLAEMDARARALGHRSLAEWVGLNNYEHMGGDDWTATRLIEELRAATPEWGPDT